MLANSFGEVGRRISGRGKHIANFSRSYSAQEIAVAAHAVLYAEGIPLSQLLGQPIEAVLNEIENARLVWAPDGDAAFDDGSIVLQMDVDREVRLIGFRNSGLQFSEIGDVSEVWLDSKVYYDVLNEWARSSEGFRLKPRRGGLPALSRRRHDIRSPQGSRYDYPLGGYSGQL